VSSTPVIKMGVLLVRSPARRQGLAMWAEVVIPTGMPLIGPDTSLDVRPGAVSEEAAGSDGSEPLAVGLSGAADAAATVAYVSPPSGDLSCRPPEAAFSPVAPIEVAGRGWALCTLWQAPKSRPS
jgi:hypothetical protein